MGDALTRLLSITAAAFALFVCGLALPAQAQATRTWVSGTGDDANPCSRTAPCKTFAGAISKTAAGGEIDTIDNGAFGTVTINKALSIVGMGPGRSGVLAPGTNGITVNAGPTDVVRIEGLAIEGQGTGTNGIRFIAGAALHVRNCLIYGFNAANADGIAFTPAANNPELYVSDSTIAENGAGQGGGIDVGPTGTAGAVAVIDNVRFENNNTFAIRADGNGSSGIVHIAARNSVFAGSNSAGAINARDTGSGVSTISVSGSTITNNLAAFGANGAGATVIVSKSIISLNTTVASASAGGVVFTNGDNSVAYNGAIGTWTLAPLQ